MFKLADYIGLNNLYFKDIFEGIDKPWKLTGDIEGYIEKNGPRLVREAGFIKAKKDVYLSRNVQLHPNAEIIGPALIGENSEIGSSVLLREGVIIGKNCNIGHGSELKHSIIGNNTNAAHFNYVGDSIIGSGVNLAAGAILANYKNGAADLEVKVMVSGKKVGTGLKKFGALIGDEVKLGCNVVTDPGTVIGRNTLVYPLSFLHGTIPANQIVKHKPRLEIADKK